MLGTERKILRLSVNGGFLTHRRLKHSHPCIAGKKGGGLAGLHGLLEYSTYSKFATEYDRQPGIGRTMQMLLYEYCTEGGIAAKGQREG